MRLIDADKLIERINGTGYVEQIKSNFLFIANMLPTVDAVSKEDYDKMKDLAEQYKFEYECVFEAHKEVLNEVLPKRVEVVRCKDCKWYDNIGCALIIVDEEDRPKPDDYCSYGERKKNE